MLCQTSGGGIDPFVYEIFRDIVIPAVGAEALCTIDSSLVQTLDHCLSSEVSDDHNRLAELFYRLAQRWYNEGVLERADQLYRAAYQVLEIIEGGRPNGRNESTAVDRISILQARALLMLTRGNTQEARSLAELQLSIARAELQAGNWVNKAALLRGTLEFIVEIYESLRLTPEAQAIRQELQELQ
jgi:hypothetical protein